MSIGSIIGGAIHSPAAKAAALATVGGGAALALAACGGDRDADKSADALATQWLNQGRPEPYDRNGDGNIHLDTEATRTESRTETYGPDLNGDYLPDFSRSYLVQYSIEDVARLADSDRFGKKDGTATSDEITTAILTYDKHGPKVDDSYEYGPDGILQNDEITAFKKSYNPDRLVGRIS